MKQKERLVELMEKENGFSRYMTDDERRERLAQVLLDSGVIVPPCKVGDTVYIVTGDNVILDETVVSIEEINDKTILVNCTNEWLLFSGWFGTNVFLDRKEAEQALKERETK